MRYLLTVVSALLFLVQYGSPGPLAAQTGKDTIFGRVVRYDSVSNVGTANADMIVLLNGDRGLVRLLYSPHHFGFDAPPADAGQQLPHEMFTNGKQTWQFHVHDALTPEEKAQCASIPKKGVRDKEGNLKLVPAFAAVRGNESVIVPSLESLPCRIIVGWNRE